MNEVRIGVIGAGSMGRAHIAAIQSTEGARVEAICEPDAARAALIVDEFGPVQVTSELEDLLRRDLDAVVIASPEALHCEAAIQALAAGKHLLIEKPLTTDVSEAHRIRDAARAAGTVVMAGFNLRYDERHRSLKRWIDDGGAGTLHSMYLRRNRPQSLFRTYQRVHPAFESSSHDIDLLLWLTGSRAARVSAVQRARPGDANPFAIWAIVELASGVVGTIEAAWTVPDGAGVARSDLVEVIGSLGTAHLDVEKESIAFWEDGGLTEERRRPQWDATTHTPTVAEEIADFVACVRAGRPSRVADFDDAVHAVEIAVAMIQSAESGHPVELSGDRWTSASA